MNEFPFGKPLDCVPDATAEFVLTASLILSSLMMMPTSC